MALADEILIRLEVNSTKAERNLQNVSKSLDRVAAEASDAIRPMDVLETQFDEVGLAAYNAKLRITDFNNPLGKIPPITKQTLPPLGGLGKGLGGIGRNAGMAGIQLQQFVGQLQGGVNPMVALSQQGADLGFVLGAPLLGAIVGIGASLAGVLLPSLFGAEDGFEKLAERVKKSKKEFEELGIAQQQALTRGVQIEIENQKKAIEGLNREIDLFNENAKDTVTLNSGVTLVLEEEATLTQKQKDQLLLLNEERETAVIRLGELETQLGQYLGLIPIETAETRAAKTAKEAFVKSIEEQIAAFGKNKAELLQQKALTHGLEGADLALVDALVELINKQEEETEAKKRAVEQARQLAANLRLLQQAQKIQQAELDAATATYKSYNEAQERQAQALREAIDPWARYDRILEQNKKLLAEKRITLDEYTAAHIRLLGQINATIEAEEKAKNKDKSLQEQYKATMMTTDELAMRGLRGMEDALVGVVNGSMSAKDAFKQMALSIVNDMIRMQMQQMILNTMGFFGFGGGSTGGTTTAPPSNPVLYGLGGGYTGVGSGNSKSMKTFAGGGYTGHGARSGGMDNKGGFPAILHPNETVIDHNKGQTMGDTVNVSINVSTGVAQTVRAEMMAMLPSITNATKAAVLDARRRGGAFAATFGA